MGSKNLSQITINFNSGGFDHFFKVDWRIQWRLWICDFYILSMDSIVRMLLWLDASLTISWVNWWIECMRIIHNELIKFIIFSVVFLLLYLKEIEWWKSSGAISSINDYHIHFRNPSGILWVWGTLYESIQSVQWEILQLRLVFISDCHATHLCDGFDWHSTTRYYLWLCKNGVHSRCFQNGNFN